MAGQISTSDIDLEIRIGSVEGKLKMLPRQELIPTACKLAVRADVALYKRLETLMHLI